MLFYFGVRKGKRQEFGRGKFTIFSQKKGKMCGFLEKLKKTIKM